MGKAFVPCPTILRLMLDYDRDNGTLKHTNRYYWMFKGTEKQKHANFSRWKKYLGGKLAFQQVNAKGYYYGSLCNRNFLAARVAFAIEHGRWPVIVDHINRDRKDNRACNLREVSLTENNRNRTPNRNSTSKFLGVSFYKKHKNKVWVASISIKGKTRQIGRFETQEAAAAAYNAVAKKEFGEFANLNAL